MIEQILNIMNLGGSIGSVYSAISAIGTGTFQERVIELLEKQNQSLIRLSEGILYSPASHNVAFTSNSKEREVADIHRIREMLVPVQKTLRSEILSSAIIYTPDKLREEFNLDPWNGLHDIRPARLSNLDKSSDWIALAFEFDNQIFIGWQKKGMLNSILGVSFLAGENAWIDQQRPLKSLRASPSPRDAWARTGLESIAAIDSSFEVDRFLAGARNAYERVVLAFAVGERQELRELLTRNVYEGFDTAIRARESRNEIAETRFISIDTYEIVHAELRGRIGNITVRFLSRLVSVTRNQLGDVIDGSPETITSVVDVWTFVRDLSLPSPNWRIDATVATDER
jgi:hypothetical protein